MKRLLTPEFMRAHPVKSGMVWAAGFAPAMMLGKWLVGQFNWIFVAVIVPFSILGGLAWGFAMKAYYSRMEQVKAYHERQEGPQ